MHGHKNVKLFFFSTRALFITNFWKGSCYTLLYMIRNVYLFFFFLIFETMQIRTVNIFVSLKERRKMNNVGNIVTSQNLISTELINDV